MTGAAMGARLAGIAAYQDWLRAERGLEFADYEALWRWSTSDLEGFWSSLWRFFAIESPTPWRYVLEAPVMPGARWFPGAQVNFARQALRHADAAQHGLLKLPLHESRAHPPAAPFDTGLAGAAGRR